MGAYARTYTRLRAIKVMLELEIGRLYRAAIRVAPVQDLIVHVDHVGVRSKPRSRVRGFYYAMHVHVLNRAVDRPKKHVMCVARQLGRFDAVVDTVVGAKFKAHQVGNLSVGDKNRLAGVFDTLQCSPDKYPRTNR